MVCYIKREIFRKLDSDVINKWFQAMRMRKDIYLKGHELLRT
jgi:glucuronate isomerase